MQSDRAARRAPWAASAALLLALLFLPLLFLPATASAGALWYDFAEPYAAATGPAETVFDYSTQACEFPDIPDQPARAFRDAAGQVNLIATHHTVRRKIGPSLTNVVHQCAPVATATDDTDPSKWDEAEWLTSFYTYDGTTVYGLIHDEFHGWKRPPGYCVQPGETWDDMQKCWYNAITLAKSTDGGATFTHTTPPTHYVASIPYKYAVGIGPSGFFGPSNIVRGMDGYHYVIVHVEGYGVQEQGACLWRSRDLSDPKSWRAWSGSGFTVRFLDPYVNNITDPAQHACAPVGPESIQTGSETLTWNTYFKKWLLVRASGGGGGTGFYSYTSDDLINWEPAHLVMNAKLPWEHVCGEPDYVLYPSLLDPDSTSRNFETTGQRPLLFFTHFNVGYSGTGCYMAMDRDLVRVPMEFSNQAPGGPSASLAASTTSARTGEHVTFDASGSSDADGSITRYQWDLDGDGSYERDTGTDPRVETSYSAPDRVTVTVRVSDDDGKATDETRLVRVSGLPLGSSAGEAASGRPAPGTRTGPGPTASTAVARFRLIGRPRARRDGTVSIRIHAPTAGQLRVRGSRIHAAGAVATRAGTLSLRIRPSRRGLAVLGRRHVMRVRMLIAFTPVGGAPQRERRTIALRAKRR